MELRRLNYCQREKELAGSRFEIGLNSLSPLCIVLKSYRKFIMRACDFGQLFKHTWRNLCRPTAYPVCIMTDFSWENNEYCMILSPDSARFAHVLNRFQWTWLFIQILWIFIFNGWSRSISMNGNEKYSFWQTFIQWILFENNREYLAWIII